MAIPCPTVPHINLQTMHRFLDDDIFAPLADLLGHDDPSGKKVQGASFPLGSFLGVRQWCKADCNHLTVSPIESRNVCARCDGEWLSLCTCFTRLILFPLRVTLTLHHLPGLI